MERLRGAAALGLLALSLSKPALAAPPASPPSELERLQRAARRRAGLELGPYAEMLRRLRVAALLPDVTVSLWRGLQLARPTEPLLSSGGDPDRMSFSVTARWDLARLVFSRDELALRAQAERVERHRQAASAAVGRLYQRRAQALQEGTEEAAQRAEALAAELEALTGEILDE